MDHLEEAKRLKGEFKIKEAAAEFQKAFDENGKSVEAAANAGLCQMMLGALDKAQDMFSKALALSPGDDLIKLYIQMLDVAQGKPYEAIPVKDRNISVSEQFMTTSEMFYQIQMRDPAFKLFETAVSTIRDNEWLSLASNQYRIVAMLARFGFFMEAKQIADNLAKENDKTWHGYASLAQIELEQGHIDEAKSLFKKAIQHGGDKDALVISAIADTRLLQVGKAKH